MLAIAEMIIQLALERALHDNLRQSAQRAALTGQLQAAGPGPLGQIRSGSPVMET
jgi:hypothetical protein